VLEGALARLSSLLCTAQTLQEAESSDDYLYSFRCMAWKGTGQQFALPDKVIPISIGV